MSEAVAWDDDGTPRSPRFDDIYRSATGGLAQAQHVFLQGCGLPEAWAGQPQWRVLETGFGLGLNFLACWHAWRTDPQRPALLHFASVEAWPVAAADLLRGVASYPALQPLAEDLAAQWLGLTPGVHRLSFEQGRVLLTLCVGDVHATLREQQFHADAVFLDGFDPARNPAMWDLPTLKAVTRLSRQGARLATWTVSGQLRRDLHSCGWQLAKRPGLPPKRECLAGRYDPSWEAKGRDDAAPPQPSQAVVIGAGLSGAAVAASLARRGWSVRVLDAARAPAEGASALPVGLLAAHQSPDDNLLSRLTRAGVRMTLQEARERLAAGLEWQATGVLEWRGDDLRSPPGDEALAPWTRPATPAQQRTAGLATDQAAWWHEQAAWIVPAALVRSWLRTSGVRFQGASAVARIARVDSQWVVQDAQGATLAQAPLVVVAAALGSAPLLSWAGRVHAVRGQVSWAPLEEEDASALPPFPVNGHGHFLPRVPMVDRGAWITGSTYGRGETDATPRDEDDAANVQRVAEVLPHAGAALRAASARGQLRHWAGVRCAASDRRPLVGEVEPGLWVSTGMGSRGLSFAALCAELIAARLHREPLPIEARLAQALDVSRLGPARSG